MIGIGHFDRVCVGRCGWERKCGMGEDFSPISPRFLPDFSPISPRFPPDFPPPAPKLYYKRVKDDDHLGNIPKNSGNGCR